MPLYTIQLRKAYGLGPAAMGNSYAKRDLRLAWPTAESGAMGLEGAALLVRRDEIAETDDPAEARRIRDEFAENLRRQGSALNAGRRYEFDDVIAPEETRDRLIALLRFAPKPLPRTEKKHPDRCVVVSFGGGEGGGAAPPLCRSATSPPRGGEKILAP